MNDGKKAQLTNEILETDIWALIRRFSLPAIIGMSINGINAFFDGLFVGQFVGESAVAAISLAFPLTFITGGISAMIGVGGAALLSQAMGAGDNKMQSSLLGICTGLSIIGSALLMVLGIIFAPEMIGILGGEGEILEQGVLYYRITLIGAFFRIHGVVLNMLIRAEGKVALAMYMSMSAALINIVLNFIFMGMFDLGISGAAWATVVSMLILTIMGYVYYMMGQANYEVRAFAIAFDKVVSKPLLSIGISAAMLQLMFFVQQSIVFILIKKYGTDWDIAFMGTCYRIMLLMVFPSFGFSIAFQPVAGINFGAKVYDRVKESFYKFLIVATISMVVPWMIIMFMPGVVIGWVLPDANVSAGDIFNFRMFVATLPLFPCFFIATTLFQAVGKARIAGILTVARDVVFFLPAALLLPMYLGVSGVYYTGIPINIISVTIAFFIIKKTFEEWEAMKSAPART